MTTLEPMSNTSSDSRRPERRRSPMAHLATITASHHIPGGFVRLTLAPVTPVSTMALSAADHYIKLLFPPAGSSWDWDHLDLEAHSIGGESSTDSPSAVVDIASLRESYPRDQWPVMRTYTLRSWDDDAGTFDIDVLLHAGENGSHHAGIASPWAQTVEPGVTIAFAGPGGAWSPSPEYQRFILIGDESAAPALLAAVEQLPSGSSAELFLEVEDASSHIEIPQPTSGAEVSIHIVERNGAVHGTELVRVVVDSGLAIGGRASWFIHGVAEMIRDIRKYLFVDHSVEKADVSVSGYWRLGMVEDEWQASKREFAESLDALEAEASENAG